MDVVGGEDGPANRARQPVEPLDPRQIVAAVKVGGGDVAQLRQRRADRRQLRLERVNVLARPGDEGDALPMLRDVRQGQLALALDRPPLPQAEQPRQPGIAFTVDGVGEEFDRLLFALPLLRSS